MNISVYLFGNFGNGYSQYPYDYTSTLFEKFYSDCHAAKQLAIHREDDLMYYGYVCRMEENRYIGFCAVVNGYYITQIESLLDQYENLIDFMGKNDYLIHSDDKENITLLVEGLNNCNKEIDIITSKIQHVFNRLENSSHLLATTSNSSSKESIREFSLKDDKEDLLKSTYTNGYTFVSKYKTKKIITAPNNNVQSKRPAPLKPPRLPKPNNPPHGFMELLICLAVLGIMFGIILAFLLA